MKKTIIAMSLALMGAFAMSAQTPANCINPANCAVTACTDSSACRPQGYCPFAGLNLTADQQTKLQALNADRQKKAKDARANAQKQRSEAKDARKNARKEYLAQVKSILTPEQYVQFLENNYTQGGRFDRGAKVRQGKFDGKKAARKDGRRDGAKRDANKMQRVAPATAQQ